MNSRIFIIILVLFSCSVYSESVKKLYDLGLSSIAEENYEEGILKLRTVYLKYPKSKYAEAARYYVGYFAEDVFQQKVEYMDFLDKYPNSAYCEEIYFQLGLNNYVTKNFKEAQFYFEKYLWNYPTGNYLNSVNFYLGVIAKENGEYDLYRAKMSKLNHYNKNPYFLMASFLLLDFYKKNGISEKIQEIENQLQGKFPPLLLTTNNLNSYWTIQLGAFKSKNRAKKYKRLLEDHNFSNIYINKIGSYYKLFSGHFSTKTEARSYLKLFEDQGYECRIIKKEKK